MSDHDWQPNETHRYSPCGLHAGALGRMDFWDAFERADECPNCVTETRGCK